MSCKKLNQIFTVVLAFMMFIAIGSYNIVSAATSEATLLNTYGKLFGKIGGEVVYSELCDSSIRNHLKTQYNSTTIGNEMKPDYILGWAPTLISVEEAKSLGYYIPDNYKESTVPKLNFSQVDNVLKTCYENGIALRAHTLVWHSQTPDWYFRSGYSKTSDYVGEDVMNARMEMYIKTYMNHVHSSQYGSVVYAWDVVNEYLHATSSGWSKVYGTPGVQAEFVKRAFQYAYDCISYFGLTDSVSLFYNDYNTYMTVDDTIKLINYINADKKICNGIGMQSHLSTTFPSVAYYTEALKKFAAAGFEIQITELDVANTSDTELANYYYDLFTAIINAKKAGANITSITFWGVSDSNSWIGDKNPLLFSNIYTPKAAYYSVLKAYTDAGYSEDSGDSGNNNGGNSDTTNNNYVTLNDGWYYIKNTNAQKYLQVKDNTGANGQNVEISTGTGVAGQKWYLTNVGEGYFTLKNALGYMLDVANGTNTDGANIQTYIANNMDAQMFKLVATSQNDVYGILTKSSKDTKALDVYNFGTSDGSNVCQWSYYQNECQKWILEPCSVTGDSSSDNNTGDLNSSSCKVALKVVSDWTDGATAEITVTNLTGNDLNNWTCRFTTNREITQVWNANLVSSEGTTYTITGPEWNGYLAAGESYTFGCSMGSGTANVEITEASLN